jgi:hypothetical protein
MLSAAKHLAAQRDRPFAALRVTVQGPMDRAHRRLIGPRWISPYPDYFVNLFIKEAYHPSSSGKESPVFNHGEELPQMFTISMYLTPM